MRIIYVAKHGSGGNDDEGAITHALTVLGHDVQRLREEKGHKAYRLQDGADFLLFHKWDDVGNLDLVKIPKVFWYFDLVNYPDSTLTRRNKNRINWMSRIIPHVQLGFCTDGDWVNQDKTGKLVHLTQGADEREAGGHVEGEFGYMPNVLFTGISRGGGQGRVSFVDAVRERYKTDFFHISQGTHQKELKVFVNKSKIILAPNSPVTDFYWSNRVYLTLGFGGFLLHPFCQRLTEHYSPGRDLLYYHTLDHLFELIDEYMNKPEARARISQHGLITTLERHLYRHRCEEMIRIIKERI